MLQQESTTSDDVRHVVWRIFCPNCLTPHDEIEHHGQADVVHKCKCTRCRRSYTVTTGLLSTGVPVATSIPVFIKAPEVVTDNLDVEMP